MTFPFRLILVSYLLAALAATASLALGGGIAAAVLVFWLGGSAGLFVLPATLSGFRRAEAALPEGLAAWEADLAAERADTRRAAMLAAWEADGAAEASAAQADRRRTDRRAG